MFLIDSNIILYSYLPEYEYLKRLFFEETVFVSEISRVEVLGYHKLTTPEESYFLDIFNLVPVIVPSVEVYNTAITIRKTYNLKLGDSIIAATALANNLVVYTRNLKDFEKIGKLKCINPIK